MRRVLLAIALLVVAGAVGGYVLVVRPLLAPAQLTPTVEAALATPDVVLMAGVNVKQAAFLERWLLGVPVTPAAHQTAARPVMDRTLLDHLRAARVDARRDLDYALYALYRTDDANFHQSLVLVGRFDTVAIDAYVDGELHGTPRTAGGRLSHELTTISTADCKPGRTWMVTADRGWVLIADPASHAVVLPRLTGQVPGESDQLAWWRPLAHGDLASIGVWNARNADGAVPDPLAKNMIKGMSAETSPFARLYVGLGVRTVPPEGRLRLVLDAADAGVAAQKIAGWRQRLNESKAQMARSVPTVATLFDSLAVGSEGARNTLELTVDRALAKNLQSVANELVGLIFSGFGIRSPTVTASAQRAERIDPQPATFHATASASALAPYDAAAMFGEDVDQVQGPFGLRLSEMRLGSDPDVGLELVVESFAGAIPNVTDEAQRARLFVDSVKSRTGQELLRPETCGRHRNDEPAAFTSWMAPRLKATKVARLMPGVDPHALGSIAGHIEVRLPTRTETVTISKSQPVMKAERNGATFVVSDVTDGTVRYQIVGARANVLHFRALNAAGQSLASGGGFFADFLLGEGVSGHKEYAGVVDRVEVVFAAEEQTLRMPFTLSDLSLAGKPRSIARDSTPPFQPYGYAALRRDHPRLPVPGKPGALAVTSLDPFELSFDKATAYFGTMLEFTFRSPIVPDFEKAFTVGRLRLTRVELADGTRLEPLPAGAAPKPMISVQTWDTAIRFGSAPKDGALTTSLRLFLDAKLKAEDIKALRGTVTVQFPRTLQAVSLNDLTPGQRAELGDLTATVTTRGRNGFTLLVNKDGNRVLYTRIMNADGQPIAFFSPNITAAPDGTWRFELSPLGTPAGAELIVAGELDRKDYAFTLIPTR